MDLEKFYDSYWGYKDDSVDYQRLALVIDRVPADQKVLEVGCQLGLLAEKLQEKGAWVVGTDLSLVALKRAQKRGLKVLKVDTDCGPLPFKDKSFDVVVSSSAIEHTFFPGKYFSECQRVLKQGGTFILLIPNIAHWRFRLWLLLGRFPYIRNTPTDELHIRFFTIKEIKQWCQEFHLKIVEVDGNAGLWVSSLYGRIFRKFPVKNLYLYLVHHLPSLLARDFVLVIRKV